MTGILNHNSHSHSLYSPSFYFISHSPVTVTVSRLVDMLLFEALKLFGGVS